MGAPETRAPLGPFFFQFMQFLRKNGRNKCWCAHQWGWHPFVWEILDPPLLQQIIRFSVKKEEELSMGASF